MRFLLLPWLLVALTGCQTTDSTSSASAVSNGSMDRIYAVQETAGAMQAAEFDPTRLAKTAVMMENYRRMQAASADIPQIMEGHRQRALAFCKRLPQTPECRQLLAVHGQARPE